MTAMSSSMADALRRRLRAARGSEPCDLVLKNARFLDVFTCAFVEGDIAIKDGFAVPGRRIIVVAGVPFGTPGATNMVRIALVGPDAAG